MENALRGCYQQGSTSAMRHGSQRSRLYQTQRGVGRLGARAPAFSILYIKCPCMVTAETDGVMTPVSISGVSRS